MGDATSRALDRAIAHRALVRRTLHEKAMELEDEPSVSVEEIRVLAELEEELLVADEVIRLLTVPVAELGVRIRPRVRRK